MNLNTMKNLVLIIALTLSLVAVSDAQVTAGFRIGYAQTVKPNTDYLLFNMQDPGNEMLFNVNEVRNFGQFSLMLRTDKRPFWFVAELTYGQSKTTYVTRYIRNFEPGQPWDEYQETIQHLDIPLSAGVSLGKLEIFSGFTLTKNLSISNEMSRMGGFSMHITSTHLGWHTGIGMRFGKFTLDLRYQQHFANYGKGRFFRQQELILRNAPGRVLTAVGFNF